MGRRLIALAVLTAVCGTTAYGSDPGTGPSSPLPRRHHHGPAAVAAAGMAVHYLKDWVCDYPRWPGPMPAGYVVGSAVPVYHAVPQSAPPPVTPPGDATGFAASPRHP